MEDILASIRRILNEDEVTPASPGAPEEPAPGASPPPHPAPKMDDGNGVLVLDEAMLVHDPIAPAADAFAAVPIEAAPVPVDRLAEHVGEPSAPPVANVAPGDSLMAPESTAAAAASVGSLLRTLSQERSTQVYRGGPTIEDLVREEVRPLLKQWLDTHLPPLVERLVRQEIERVAGRAAF